MHAIGGIDLALWDLYGKISGKPVHDLIGGAKRDRIPAYGTIYPMQRTSDAVKRQVSAARERNLKAFKLCADPWWMDDLALTGKLLMAARQEAGPMPQSSSIQLPTEWDRVPIHQSRADQLVGHVILPRSSRERPGAAQRPLSRYQAPKSVARFFLMAPIREPTLALRTILRSICHKGGR